MHKSIELEIKKAMEEEHTGVSSSYAEMPQDYQLSKSHGDKEYEHKGEAELLKELQKEFDLININNPIVSFEMVCGSNCSYLAQCFAIIV